MHSIIQLTKENEGGEMDGVIKRYWILDAGYWMEESKDRPGVRKVGIF